MPASWCCSPSSWPAWAAGASRACPTGFIPNEDQGYLLIGVQLPDGASLERTGAALDQVSAIAQATPGVEHVVAIGGLSVLDSNSSPGQCRRRLRDPEGLGRSRRAAGAGPALDRHAHLRKRSQVLQDGRAFPLVPPAIQGIGNAGGFQMQVEQRDGSFDYVKLQNATQNVIEQASTQSALEQPRHVVPRRRAACAGRRRPRPRPRP